MWDCCQKLQSSEQSDWQEIEINSAANNFVNLIVSVSHKLLLMISDQQWLGLRISKHVIALNNMCI